MAHEGGADLEVTHNDSGSCHTFSANQILDIVIVKSVMSAVAVFMCLVGVIAILALRQYRTFVHRLVLYLMVGAFIQAICTGLEVAPIHRSGNDVEVRHGLKDLCFAIGFAEQVTLSQLMLILTWILVYLFLLVVFKYKTASKKHEIAGLLISIVFPLTFDWLPFVHDLYGLAGAWCWIRVTGKDCHHLIKLGVIFQLTLFYGPKMILVLLSFVTFLVIAVILCKRNYSHSQEIARSEQSPYQKAVKEALPLVLYPVLYNIIVGVMVANRIDYAIAVAHDVKPLYPLFLAHATVDPMRNLFVPLAYLLHPGTVRKLLGRDRPKRSEDSETNYPVPPEPSYSEVDPLVIRGSTNSMKHDYGSIFDDNKQ